jgi:hypothetical protein
MGVLRDRYRGQGRSNGSFWVFLQTRFLCASREKKF